MDPYGSLEPRRSNPLGSDLGLLEEASWPRVLARGARKRCPRCGESGIWRGWFLAREKCPACGLRFEREEGGFVGAMALNFAFAMCGWLIVLGIGIALTVPDIPVGPLLAASIVVLVALPLWFYPRSKMIWAAMEFLVARSEPEYRSPLLRDPREKDLE